MINTSYHSQTDDLSERINQIVEIALRFMIIENSDLNVFKTLSTLQISLNNVTTISIEFSLNEFMYDFKIKNVLTTLFNNKHDITAISTSNMNVNKIKKVAERRFMYVKKIVDVTIFVNAKTKIYYDKKHQSLLLRSSDEVYIRFHHEYKLSNVMNKKLKNQRIDSFLMKRRVGRLIYELNLSFK